LHVWNGLQCCRCCLHHLIHCDPQLHLFLLLLPTLRIVIITASDALHPGSHHHCPEPSWSLAQSWTALSIPSLSRCPLPDGLKQSTTDEPAVAYHAAGKKVQLR
jgi:hypothetical protein